MKRTAIFVCGPTAVGKTKVAIHLANFLKTEIISFDSRQFFKELKIGAAPPDKNELAMAHHHLIGQLSINSTYNAGSFEKDALGILDQLFKKHQTAVLVGGSGLYMKALIEGFDSMPEIDPSIREKLVFEYEKKGIEFLQDELRVHDPQYFAKVDTQNPQRLLRALEVFKATGKTYSSFRKSGSVKRNFEILKIGLNLDREELYERINHRVDKMILAGLEEEVRSLLPFKENNSLQTVGYKEFFECFEGNITREQAIEEIKKNSRRYAKRQLTWFRRDPEISWFSPFDISEIKEHLTKQLSL